MATNRTLPKTGKLYRLTILIDVLIKIGLKTPEQEMMLQSWEEGAQNLIQHFRAVCRGQIPLNMEWSKADQDAAEVDDRSLHFIADLNRVALSRGMPARCKAQVKANGVYQLRIFVEDIAPLRRLP